MRKIMITMFLALLTSVGIMAQNVVKGVVVDSNSENPLQGVSVSIKSLSKTTLTNADGSFSLTNITNGSYVVEISFKGYESGHMMYLRREDLKNANNDIRDFIQMSLPGKQAAKYTND